jgi:hypothetical protein
VSPDARYRVEFSDGRDLVSLPYTGELSDARIGAFLEEQFARNPGFQSPLPGRGPLRPPERARVITRDGVLAHEYGAQPFLGPGFRRGRRSPRRR